MLSIHYFAFVGLLALSVTSISSAIAEIKVPKGYKISCQATDIVANKNTLSALFGNDVKTPVKVRINTSLDIRAKKINAYVTVTAAHLGGFGNGSSFGSLPSSSPLDHITVLNRPRGAKIIASSSSLPMSRFFYREIFSIFVPSSVNTRKEVSGGILSLRSTTGRSDRSNKFSLHNKNMSCKLIPSDKL